jgi:hypothetical protein
VTLKKPSEYFNKKEVPSVDVVIQEVVEEPELNTFSDAFDSFKKNLSKIETLSDFSETLDNYRVNIERVNYLSEKVEDIQTEISSLLKKEDLDRAMMSQLLIVEQSIRDVQDKVKSINQKTLSEIRLDVSDLTEVVNEFIEVEVPKYKKLIVSSELRTNNRFEELEKNINQSIQEIVENVDDIRQNKLNLVEVIDEKLNDIQDIQKVVIEDVEKNSSIRDELTKKVTDLEVEIIRNESHIRVQNKNLHHLQENIRDEIKKLNLDEIEEKNHKLLEKINYLEEIFEKFSEREILTETIVVEPPSTKTSDPLTPLDQNFVTLDQLQQHYRLFINRIQQQLATLGGGGETRLRYLDDVVGIATNPSAYDGKFLKYNHSIGKFEFEEVTSGGGNAAISISDTPPLEPEPGNLWYDNTIGRTFIYYQDEDGSQWVDASPSGLFGNWTYNNTETYTQTNVGIGTTTLILPTSKVEVYGGDLRVGINTSEGLIMTSPNGTNYRLIVNNDGTLATVAV